MLLLVAEAVAPAVLDAREEAEAGRSCDAGAEEEGWTLGQARQHCTASSGTDLTTVAEAVAGRPSRSAGLSAARSS